MDDAFTGSFHAFVFPAGYHSQHCATHTRALFRLQTLQLNIQDICHNLFPQGALGTAATDLGGADLDAQASGNLHAVPNGKGHTLQYRLGQIGPVGVHGHADKGSPGVGVVDGAAFPHEIWQEIDVVFAQLTPVRTTQHSVWLTT